MITHSDALHHSPALWGLCAGLAAFTGIAVVTVGWNLWDHRAELRQWARL